MTTPCGSLIAFTGFEIGINDGRGFVVRDEIKFVVGHGCGVVIVE